jgi:hypothetical protein
MRVLLKNTYGKTEEGYSGKANRVFAKTEEGYSGKAKHNNIDINNTINNTISSKEEIYSTEICISKEKSELDLSLDQYAIMRNKMRKPMTDRAKQLLLNKMQGYTEQEQIELLEEATLK